MIHQHWVAASLFLVSVVHGVANQGNEEITGGASNETGDFYFWLPFVIFFQVVRRQWVHRLVHKWDHQWQVFPSEVFLSSDLMPFKEMLPIINPLLQLLLMELVIFHFDSTWSYFIRQSDLHGSDYVDGQNNLVISDLGFWFYIIQGNGTDRHHPPAPDPAEDTTPDETAETGDFSYCDSR